MRTILTKKRFVVACTLLVLSVLCCVDEYNPFDDNANASTRIVKSSYNSETIPLFTTDSIELLFTVCNLIEKVSIRVTKNRYFDTMTIDDVCGKEMIKVSFYDTGYQEIRIVTFRQNGDSVVLKKRYHVYSDLVQNTISGYYRDTLHLNATTENKNQDKDIQYIWKIGPVKPVKSQFGNAIIIIDELVNSDSGQLFICDNQSKYYSPAFYFNVVLFEPLPQIVIAGTDSDSLYTSSDSIDLKVQIEKSISQVTVHVNGQQMVSDVIPNTFFKKIIKTNSPIQKLTIVAIDSTGERASRVVYVEFNSNKQQSINPRLEIMELMTNGVVTVTQEKHSIAGRVEFYANHKINYTVALFEKSIPIKNIEKYENSSFDWNFPVVLKNETTIFRIELSDSLNNVLDDTTLMINYCKDCIDTVPPVIASITVDGVTLSSGASYKSNKKDVKIELICYEEAGADSVFLNNALMRLDAGTNYRWSIDSIAVNHIARPDTFCFYAIDKNGNTSVKDTIVVGYNTPPRIKICPDSIEHALSGTLYTSYIDIHDEDINDFVTYSILKADVRNIFIDEKGIIKWTPEKSDTGFHTVMIRGVDRGNDAVIFSYCIYVSENPLDTVKFVTSRNEFPNLVPCTDSIVIPLKIRGGTKPFVFEITDRTKNKPILVNKAQPYFNWKPDCASDTGAHQFFIVVRDTLRLSDTLWPVITVLPPNRDFEVKELRWSGSRKADFALDLSRNRTDTLFFKITDPDNPQYEHHTIEVTSGPQKYSVTTDSGNFFIPLSHLVRVSGRDSLVMNVKDKGSHVKRIVYKLDYGKPPLPAILLKPHNDSIIESKDIQFRWSCSDPDGESLKYHFTLQFIDGTFRVDKEVQDTFCTVSGLKKAGVYYWSIIASDNKSSINSLTGKITCLPADRVRIDTTVSKLPELIHCKTSKKAPVVIKNGYPPFTFTCSPPVIIDGDSLAWVPDCNKTGSYKINLMVKDSVGNTDTYTFSTSVYGSDSLDLKMVNTVLRNGSGEIDLSDPLVKTVVCTLAIIDPDPSPPENFIVDVYLGNLQQQYFNNYVGRTFLVSLKPDISKTRDTLSVNVTDMNGNKRNLTEALYYGD